MLNVFMYYAAPGVGQGILMLSTTKNTCLIFEKKMYTVNEYV